MGASGMRTACQDDGVASRLRGDASRRLPARPAADTKVRGRPRPFSRHTAAGTLTTHESDGYPGSVCSSSRERYAPAMALAYRSELVMAFLMSQDQDSRDQPQSSKAPAQSAMPRSGCAGLVAGVPRLFGQRCPIRSRPGQDRPPPPCHRQLRPGAAPQPVVPARELAYERSPSWIDCQTRQVRRPARRPGESRLRGMSR